MTTRTLAAGAADTLNLQGLFFFVRSATAALVYAIETIDGRVSTYRLREREQLRFLSEIRSVTVTNDTGSSATVELATGYAEFIPAQDGQRVVIDGTTGALPVTGPLTDAELRAAPVPVTGGLTDAELRAAPVPVTGGLTDAELRAAPVDVAPVIYTTATPLAVITGSGAIPANPDRAFLVIKALSTNTGIGWTAGAANNGDAIEAGDRVIYETTAGVTITATVPGDQFAILEIEA